MTLGSVLSLCNIYIGLKIGWGFNVSITAALLGFGIYGAASRWFGARTWNIYENNINQTSASAAASISSAGLVSAIPALSMLTGKTFSWGVLVVWTCSVALVGVVVAVGLRRQMLFVDRLTFPMGVATGETLRQMYAEGSEALRRVRMLLTGALVSGALKIVVKVLHLSKLSLPGSLATGASLHAAGLSAFRLKNLGVGLEPSLLLMAVGMLIGIRSCVSLFLGAVVAWLWIVPTVMNWGWIQMPMQSLDPWGLVWIPDTQGSWYVPAIKWLLWPGVAMMVTSALTSFAFSWRSVVTIFVPQKSTAEEIDPQAAHVVPRRWYWMALCGVLCLSVLCQVYLF
ncbi:MAG: OPT/YSL family transporter, partial [Myxococcota bacterium]